MTKKHKQRFEHTVELIGDSNARFNTLYECLEHYQIIF
jgi:hypothetical protein